MTSIEDTHPHFSLVMSTKDRTTELVRFLESLDRQTDRSFELIVSDQNGDDRLAPLLAPFADRFTIRTVRSAGGISRGRNAGLPLVRGSVVAFPDDDCWYPPHLLATVRRLFALHADWDVVSGRSVDEAMRDTQGRWPDRMTVGERSNMLRMGISYSIFARTGVVADTGPFDETLGVGAGTPWGSGEETDFLLRALAAGRKLVYTPELFVHHPEKIADYSRRARDRQFAYSRGLGRVLGKHRYTLAEAFSLFVRPLGGAALFLLRGQADRSLCYLRIFFGRGMGFLGR